MVAQPETRDSKKHKFTVPTTGIFEETLTTDGKVVEKRLVEKPNKFVNIKEVGYVLSGGDGRITAKTGANATNPKRLYSGKTPSQAVYNLIKGREKSWSSDE